MTTLKSSSLQLDADAAQFYRRVLRLLNDAGVPFLVGGAYGLNCYTTIERHTKDLDLFVRREHLEPMAELLRADGMSVELTYPHWLAKAREHPDAALFIDFIFSSGNGLSDVDDAWFRHAEPGEVLGVPVHVCPAEEMIWSKAFIMERERYDGADVAHLLHARADSIDWRRLLHRFGARWRVLFSHLVLFGFVYPAERSRVPSWLMDRLIERLRAETLAPAPASELCAGTLLSREQYLSDIEQQGYADGRVIPFGNMTPDDVADWTAGIPDRRADAA
jgi:hypothetical protein